MTKYFGYFFSNFFFFLSTSSYFYKDYSLFIGCFLILLDFACKAFRLPKIYVVFSGVLP